MSNKSKITPEYLKKINKRVRDRNYRFQKLTDPQKRVRIAKDVIENIEAGKLLARSNRYLSVPDMRGYFEAASVREMFQFRIEHPASSYGTSKEDNRREVEAATEKLETPLHAVFDKAESCTVCAIGGVFVSAVLRSDGLKVKDLAEGTADHNKMREYLGEYFSLKQLGMIEAAFEMAESFAERFHVASSQVDRAVRFGDRYEDPEDRMIAIMENIVENEGTFKP